MQTSGTQQVVPTTANQFATSTPSHVERGRWHQRGCIFKVDENSKIAHKEYTPEMLSIGPLHYGKPQFAITQPVKEKHASNFTNRVTNRITNRVGEDIIADFRNFLRVNELLIRASYAWDTSEIASQKFVQIISCDAMFFIEILLKSKEGQVILSDKAKMELLMLENQIPLFVHLDLWERYQMVTYQGERHSTDIVEFLHLFSKFFEVEEYLACGLSNATARAACHLLDLRRLMETGGLKENRTTAKCLQVKNASALPRYFELKPIFQRNMSSYKFSKTIWHPAILEIPQVYIGDYWALRIVNMMAFENYYYQYMEERLICQFMYLLCSLIKEFEDMQLLMDHKILIVEHPNWVSVYEKLKKIRLELKIFVEPTHYTRPIIWEELDKEINIYHDRMVQLQKIFSCLF